MASKPQSPDTTLLQDLRYRGLVRPVMTIAMTGFLLVGCTSTTDENAVVPTVPEIVVDTPENIQVLPSTYVSGVYSATGNYTSPAGEEQVDVSLTITNDVISDVQFTGKATHPTSVKLQGMFAEGFREEVVGKSVDELSLGVVNGSSLAPKGFMDAVSKIKVEAMAS